MYGGKKIFSINEFNVFDTISKKWNLNVGVSNDPIDARYGHSTCLFNDKMIIAFGKNIN